MTNAASGCSTPSTLPRGRRSVPEAGSGRRSRPQSWRLAARWHVLCARSEQDGCRSEASDGVRVPLGAARLGPRPDQQLRANVWTYPDQRTHREFREEARPNRMPTSWRWCGKGKSRFLGHWVRRNLFSVRSDNLSGSVEHRSSVDDAANETEPCRVFSRLKHASSELDKPHRIVSLELGFEARQTFVVPGIEPMRDLCHPHHSVERMYLGHLTRG
jgi:hypothetical protein